MEREKVLKAQESLQKHLDSIGLKYRVAVKRYGKCDYVLLVTTNEDVEVIPDTWDGFDVEVSGVAVARKDLA